MADDPTRPDKPHGGAVRPPERAPAGWLVRALQGLQGAHELVVRVRDAEHVGVQDLAPLLGLQERGAEDLL